MGGNSTNDAVHPTAKDNPPIADVILVDRNGIMHERSAGIATFLEVSMNQGTIRVGKTPYCFDGLTKNGVSGGAERRVTDF